MNQKQRTNILYKNQKTHVQDLKAHYKGLVRDKIAYSKRKPYRKEIKLEEAKLARLKEDWHRAIEDYKTNKDTLTKQKQVLQALDSGSKRTIKRAEKALANVSNQHPTSDWFEFELLSKRSVKPEDKKLKIYLGRFLSGGPWSKNRHGFIMRLNIKDKQYIYITKKEAEGIYNKVIDELDQAAELKDKLQQYYNENKDFFGRVVILLIERVANTNDTWDIRATTGKKQIVGFEPPI